MSGYRRGKSTEGKSRSIVQSLSAVESPGVSLIRFVPSPDTRTRVADRVGGFTRRLGTGLLIRADDGLTGDGEALKTAEAALAEARALAVDLDELRRGHAALEEEHDRLLAQHEALLDAHDARNDEIAALQDEVEAGLARIRRVDEALKTLSRRVASSSAVSAAPEPDPEFAPRRPVRAVRSEFEDRDGSDDAKRTSVLGELRSFGAGGRPTRAKEARRPRR